MLGRLSGWLFGASGVEGLPERVREAIRRQQEQSEILIGWAELVGPCRNGCSMCRSSSTWPCCWG